jgi:hypothetical protein
MTDVIILVNPVCDFCSGKPIVVAYLVEDFSLPEFHWGSMGVGAFAACAPCRELIEGGRVLELERRSVESFRGEPGLESIPQRVLEKFIRTLHREFWMRLRGGTKQ